MNPLSNDGTKQSANQDNYSYKSLTKNHQSYPSTASLPQHPNSLEKKMDGIEYGNHPQLYQDMNIGHIDLLKKTGDDQPKGGINSASSDRPGGLIMNNTQIIKVKTPQRPLDSFFTQATTSVNQDGEKQSKKRKSHKVSKTPEKSGESLAVTTTKKIKTTNHLNNYGDETTLIKFGNSHSDSSVNSAVVDNRPAHLGKESYQANVAPSKITDFFTKRPETVEDSTFLTSFSQTSKYITRTKHMNSVIQEEPDLHESEKLKYIARIQELEGKLEAMRRERERDSLKAESALNAVRQDFDDYKERVKKILAKMSLQIENFKRMERKSMLNQQKQRLGEYVTQRGGSKFVDVWCDGQEMRSVKEQLISLNNEKEELEKQKKTLKPKKPLLAPQKGSNDTQLSSGFLTFFHGAENSDSNSNIDSVENRERINAKMAMLIREEVLLKERLEKLEAEKALFYQHLKKQYEEDHSRYGKPNQDTNSSAWPVLNNGYQLLSLLGKGGFSEVYQAYDLENLRSVACKIHQLNPNWTESAKNNYVKHANRESEVHKELNHPNIVRLFDCISIDDHSFATVLEYCEGPDLSSYLKQHKILSEKEAKILIRQILCGLKYLNDHKTKIIHYDMKPQNVMFHKGEIKISDFGLCKVVDPEVSRIELTSQGVGTYWYLPPECFLMDDQPPLINSKVDVWSVGVMFYEMLFGMRPFGHNMSQEKILKEQIILKSYSVNFPSKPIVSNEAKDFLKKCLSYNQEDRYDVHQAYNSVLFTKNM